ncbi:MAG: hypothetical protein AAF321_12030, partial [Pseudomonadota bacterium]
MTDKAASEIDARTPSSKAGPNDKGASRAQPGGASQNQPGGASQNQPGGASQDQPGGVSQDQPGGASQKMWGGRFAAGPAAIMEEINASIDFDKRLAQQDIRGSKAHADMLV